eukprot:5560880-Pyramimonas_sp.AAC.1
MPECAGSVVLLQEHHADAEQLPHVAHAVARSGATGVMAAVPITGRGVACGGFAVIAPPHIRVSLGPDLSGLEGAGLACAHLAL